MGFYTALIGRITDAVASMAAMAHDPRVANDLNVYNYLLLTKEHMGQERATGGAGFAAGRFTLDIHDAFKRLITAQDIYAKLYWGAARPEHRALYDSAMAGAPAREVDALRAVALEGGLDGAIGAVTPSRRRGGSRPSARRSTSSSRSRIRWPPTCWRRWRPIPPPLAPRSRGRQRSRSWRCWRPAGFRR
jgi:hypothetical protein